MYIFFKLNPGRDDQRADCILYYGFGDIFRISTMVVMENVGQQKLYGMVSYCHDMGRQVAFFTDRTDRCFPVLKLQVALDLRP